MLTLPLDASATNYYFRNLEICFATTTTNVWSSQFCDVGKVESSKKQKILKCFWLYYNGGPNSFFFFVINFCTAITQEKEYFISNAWIYYQRVVQKNRRKFWFLKKCCLFLATFLVCGQFSTSKILGKKNYYRDDFNTCMMIN
jgi:hypothetical protein